MNHFTLFAHGIGFDVDAYLETTGLNFDKVWRRGDVRGCGELQDKHPTGGVEKQLGCGWELSISEQCAIAADFLEANEDALKHLARFAGVDNFVLGLHNRILLTMGMCGFSMSASERLMSLALRTGVDVTFYVALDRRDFKDMTQEDESELVRLTAMLVEVDANLSASSPLREALHKSGVALTNSFIDGQRSDIEYFDHRRNKHLRNIKH